MIQLQPIVHETPAALIAEDNDLDRMKLVRVLKSASWQVAETADSRRILEMVTNARFDLLLLDHRMPYLLGLDVVRQLKAKGSVVPVIMVTNYPDATFQREAKELGVYRILPKPYEAVSLLQILERFLNEKKTAAS